MDERRCPRDLDSSVSVSQHLPLYVFNLFFLPFYMDQYLMIGIILLVLVCFLKHVQRHESDQCLLQCSGNKSTWLCLRYVVWLIIATTELVLRDK